MFEDVVLGCGKSRRAFPELCFPYLCDGHLRVLLLLLKLLLKQLQVVLRRQRGEGARAAGSHAVGRHGELGPPITVLSTDTHAEKNIMLMKKGDIVRPLTPDECN